jgi:hypothetical protein
MGDTSSIISTATRGLVNDVVDEYKSKFGESAKSRDLRQSLEASLKDGLSRVSTRVPSAATSVQLQHTGAVKHVGENKVTTEVGLTLKVEEDSEAASIVPLKWKSALSYREVDKQWR